MIARIKKIHLLLFARQQEEFLCELRKLGAVHIAESGLPATEGLHSLREKSKSIEKVILGLLAIIKEKKIVTGKNETADVSEITSRYEDCLVRRTDLELKKQIICADIDILQPWGEHDPAVEALLAEKNIRLRFFEISKKNFSEEAFNNIPYTVVSQDADVIRIALVDAGSGIPLPPRGEKILPLRSLRELRAKLAEIEGLLSENNHTLERLTAYLACLEDANKKAISECDMESARINMEHALDDKVRYMMGWIPAEKASAAAALLEQYECWYQIEEPSRDDTVPVLLKNNRFSRLFEAITGILSFPKYFELDPTPFFAPFFALFFGLCLGDLGYGAVIFLICIIGVLKADSKMKPYLKLGMVLGFMTMVAGVVLNTFFGAAIFQIKPGEAAFFSKGAELALLGSGAHGKEFPAMTFAIYLGAIQVMFGMTLNGINNIINKSKAYVFEIIGKLLIVIGVLAALADGNFLGLGDYQMGNLQIGAFFRSLHETQMSLGVTAAAWPHARVLASIPLMGNVLYLLHRYMIISVAGMNVLLFFSIIYINKGRKIGSAFGGWLWRMYNTATGLIGDGLSYIRLFALGLAGGLLGSSFNYIAFMFITGSDGTVNYASAGFAGTIVILIFGHTLNLGLSALGAFVHSLRLTFVEFYNNLGYDGGAVRFRPLAEKR